MLPGIRAELVLETIGLPAHDLRTLVADLLRRVDPARARGLIASMLGHSSAISGEEYRALCEGDFAVEQWRRMRGEIAGGALSR